MIPMLAALVLSTVSGPDVKSDGAFGFPQKEAKVLCDSPALRVSAWNNSEHLYVQAVLFDDNDDSIGQTEDGRKIGDNSDLVVDADANSAVTAKVDRSYTLNPWPQLPGLHYSVQLGENMSSGLQGDSKGRGAISMIEEGGKKFRVDSYLIPLAEIARKPGDKVRFAFYAHSTTPEFTVNSVGYATDKKRYYPHHLPLDKFHEFTLVERAPTFDTQQVPEGRTTIAISKKPAVPMPAVGAEAPEVVAAAWLNWKGAEPPSLKSLKGKVVVVEFWATWCGPCVAGIPHLNEVFDRHAKEGLIVLSVTDQAKKDYIEEFMKTKPMHYTVGIGSDAVEAYGVKGIPHAFVIGKDGKVAWGGYPADEAFEKAIIQALAKNVGG